MESVIYSPVVIPTLNRLNHLVRCLDSLERNSGIEETEIYISVDYPPSEKYQNGYVELCDYLKSYKSKAKCLHLFFQKENLGPLANGQYLIDKISAFYDRYIFLEDDIEVATNFLEYINKGLSLFETNESVFSVCACGALGGGDNNNVCLTQNYSAWGVGRWIAKDTILSQYMNSAFFFQLCKNRAFLLSLLKERKELLFSLQEIILQRRRYERREDSSFFPFDELIKLYCLYDNKYVIASYIYKARNWGYDGSGVNCSSSNRQMYDDTYLDGEKHFEYIMPEPLIICPYPRLHGIANTIRLYIAYFRILYTSRFRKRDRDWIE